MATTFSICILDRNNYCGFLAVMALNYCSINYAIRLWMIFLIYKKFNSLIIGNHNMKSDKCGLTTFPKITDGDAFVSQIVCYTTLLVCCH